MKKTLQRFLLAALMICGFAAQKGFGQTVTLSAFSGSLAANPLTIGQHAAIFGFTVQVAGGSVTFNKFTFSSSNASQTYFTNGTLYRTTTPGYSSSGTKVGNVTFNGTTVQVDGFTETISSTTYYYYLVADVFGGANGYDQLSIAYGSTLATDVSGTNYNTSFYSGQGYNINAGTVPPVSVKNLTTDVVAAGTLVSGSNNQKLFQYSVTNNSGSSITINSFKVNSTVSDLSKYLTSVRLYANTTNTFPGSSTATATLTTGSSYANFNSLTETIAAGATKYYWVYANTAFTGSLPQDLQLAFQDGQTSAAITTSTTTYNTFTAQSNIYNLNSAVLSVTSQQNGVASATVYNGQTGLAVFGFGVSATTGSATLNTININSDNASLSSYYSNFKLYSSTTNNFTTGTTALLASGSASGSFVTFTGLSQAISSTAKYYFLVADVSGNPTNSTTFKFTSGQSSAAFVQTTPSTTYNSFNITGNTYNTTAPTVSYSANTNGTATALTYGQTGIAVYGLNVAVTGTANVTSLTITNAGTGGNLTGVFANAKLYVNSGTNPTTNSYSTGTNTQVGTAVINSGNITITGINTAVSGTKTFYLVVDDIYYASTGYFQAIGSSITVSGNTGNTNIYGSSLNYGVPPPTVVLTGNNTAANGITQGTLQYGQTGIVLFGFKMDVTGTTTITRIAIASTGVDNTFFDGTSNGKLYRSTTPNFSVGTSTLVKSGADVSFQTKYVTISNLTEAFSTNTSATTYYYFLVADYSNVNASGSGQLKYGFDASTQNTTNGTIPAQIGFSGGSYSSPSTVTDGNNFNVGVTYDWDGANTNILDASNYRNLNNGTGAVPGTYDQLRIGVVNFAVGNNMPLVNSTAGLSKIIIGNAKTSTINFSGGNTLTLSDGITINASTTATLSGSGTLVLGSGAVSSVPSGSTLNLNSSAALNNAGAFTQAGTLSVNGASTNSGTITQSGNISFGNTLTNSGTITQSGTATLGVSSTLTNSGTITKGGTGAFTFAAVTNSSGGTITQGNATGLITFGSTLGNSGTVNSTAAAGITFTGAVTNSSGGLITLATSPGTFSSTLTNSSGGTLNFGSANTTITGDFSNAGTFNGGASPAIYDFNGTNFTNSGASNLATATIKIAATTFTNSGTFGFGTGTLTFDRGGNQAINNNSGTQLSFKNVTFTTSGTKTLGGSGTFAVTSTGLLTVGTTSTTVLAAGTAKLNLKSDINGSANVATLPTGTSITGTVNVERYLTGGAATSRGYRLISSPVSSASNLMVLPNLSYIKAQSYVSGTGTTTTGGFSNSTPANPSLYFYRENLAPAYTSFISGNYRGVNKINSSPLYNFTLDGETGTFTLPAGNGFLFFFRGGPTTTNPTTTTSIAQTATFVDLGYLNQGDITVNHWTTTAAGTAGTAKLLFTNTTGNTAVRGYNLVGNPYPSSIDWDKFDTTGTPGILGTHISKTIYIYNPETKSYATYIAGNGGVGTNFKDTVNANIIPSGQGFFVRATTSSTTPQLKFTEAAKSTTQIASNLLLMSVPDKPVALMSTREAVETVTSSAATAKDVKAALQYLKLELYLDKDNHDQTMVLFKSTAKPEFLRGEDAEYLKGNNAVALSSRSTDSRNLAINQMAFPAKAFSLPLTVKATADGIYQIKLKAIQNIPANAKIWLIDGWKKDSLDIGVNKTYNFNVKISDTASYGSTRFKLVIKPAKVAAPKLLTFNAKAVTTGAQLDWTTQTEGNVTVYSVERSINNKTWDPIGSVTSAAKGKYSYVDQFPIVGVDYYRLKITDGNGAVTYSAVKSVVFTKQVNSTNSNVSVFPNPASTTVNVAVVAQVGAKSYTIRVTGGNGTLVKSATINTTLWQTAVTSLMPGTYFVQVVNNTNKVIVGNGKFVKN